MGCFLPSYYIFTKLAVGSELYFSTTIYCHWAPWRTQLLNFGVTAASEKRMAFGGTYGSTTWRLCDLGQVM